MKEAGAWLRLTGIEIITHSVSQTTFFPIPGLSLKIAREITRAGFQRPLEEPGIPRVSENSFYTVGHQPTALNIPVLPGVCKYSKTSLLPPGLPWPHSRLGPF